MTKQKVYHIIEWVIAIVGCGYLAYRLAVYDDYAGLWAAVCFVLGMILWFGRKRNAISVILRFLPALYILAEGVSLWSSVISRRTGLFMAIVDTVCLILYLYIIVRHSKGKRQEVNTTRQIN